MTIVKLKVRRSAWRVLTQNKLPNYANNVVLSTAGKEAYSPLRDRLENLAAKSKALSNVLDEVGSKGSVYKEKKKLAIQALYAALESVAVALEENATDELYILEAGMSLQKTGTRHDSDLLPVYKLTAQSNGQKGQAILEFICPLDQRSQVQTFAVEWSDDNGITYHNGTYKNAERILVKDLPNRKDIIFRVRCVGTHGRTSEWSDIAGTFVI